MDNFDIKGEVKKLTSFSRDIKNHLHEYPEISARETATSAYLKSLLASMDIKTFDVPMSTGFVAVLNGKKPGKTLGMRCDIDALPMDEDPSNLKNKRTVVSKIPGVFHGCGHDAHMSIQMTIIKILNSRKDLFNGKIVFIFEEGEEFSTGIGKMNDFLSKNYKLDAVYGIHLSSALDTGVYSAKAGPVMAGLCNVDFDVIGRGGHGSRPDLSVNPVFCAANILTLLGTAWTNQLDVTKTVTLGITMIHGGSALNVIPDSVNIRGTLRYFDENEIAKAVNVIQNVAEGVASANKCVLRFEKTKNSIVNKPVINDKRLTEIAKNAFEKQFGAENLDTDFTWFASDTFNAYRKLAPSIYTFVGTKNHDYGSGAEHHNRYFDTDPESIYYGCSIGLQFALDFLNQD